MKKILLVDDDVDLLMLLRRVLKSRGYQVVTLEDGSEVINMIEKIRPDLLILDINIGEYDGRDICSEVKNNHSYDQIPVVLFSALIKEKEAMAGCDADAYIAKPISAPLFLRKVDSMIAA